MRYVNLFRSDKRLHNASNPSISLHRATTMREWMLRGSSRSSNLQPEVQILFLYRWHSIDVKLFFFLTIRQSEVKKILMRPHIPHKVFQYVDRGIAPAQYKETEEEQLKSPCRWTNQHPRDTRGLWWCLLMQIVWVKYVQATLQMETVHVFREHPGNFFCTDGQYSNFRDR